MSTGETLVNALDKALITARDEYQRAVLELATLEARKETSSDREPADVDHIHQARTRTIALEAAREELVRMIADGAVV